MTLTKSDIVRSVMENVRFRSRQRKPQRFLFPEMDCVFLTRKRATEIVNTLFETIKDTLAKGDDVRIYGFGKFQSKFRWARKGRHPRTGEVIILKSRRTISFRPSSRLRDRMNHPGALR